MENKNQKKLLKESLKNEVAPHLISMKEQVKKTNESVKESGREIVDTLNQFLPEVKKNVDAAAFIKGFLEVLKGDQGETGRALTFEDLTEEQKEQIRGEKGLPGKSLTFDDLTEKQKKILKGEDGKTPVKGTDYFTKAEIKEFLNAVTPIKGIHYHDGKDGTSEKAKTPIKMSATEIRSALESLNGASRLKIKSIHGLDEILKSLQANQGGGGGIGGSGGGGVTAFIALSDSPGSYFGKKGMAAVVNDAENGLVFTIISGTDEKVAYKSGSAAGYLNAVTVAGAGITLSEGTGADAGKLKITNSGILSETDPIFSSWQSSYDHHSNWDTAYGWGNHASAGYEVATNKSTNVTTDGASDTKYPSAKAVKTYADLKMPIAGGTFAGQYVSGEITDTVVAGAVTVNWASGNVHYILLGNGANTITLSNPVAGGRYIIYLKQPASGAAGTVTFSPVPLFAGGILPTLSTANNALDIVTLAYSTGIGSKYVGNYNVALA